MIFVAVGTQKFQFNRLIKTLDELKENQVICEEIFAQIGYSDYLPQNYKYKDFLSKEEFDENVKKCDLLITHGGVATIMAGLKNNKPVIVVPRLAKYGEHVDDHQLEIAEAFSRQKYVMMCGEKNNLSIVINEIQNFDRTQYISKKAEMLNIIKNYIGLFE